MTCKDCIHEKICDHFIPQGLPWDDGEFPAELFCDHFKPKSRYIELPCAVGDTVYFDAVGYHDSAEIDGIHIDAQGVMFTWVQYDVGVDITELWDEGEFDLEDIGKTVFLTHEEAEKALKRSEGK